MKFLQNEEREKLEKELQKLQKQSDVIKRRLIDIENEERREEEGKSEEENFSALPHINVKINGVTYNIATVIEFVKMRYWNGFCGIPYCFCKGKSLQFKRPLVEQEVNNGDKLYFTVLSEGDDIEFARQKSLTL